MRKLRDFIIIGAFASAVGMFLLVNLIVSVGYQDLIIKKAEHTSKNIADLLTNSIFQMMRTGQSRSEIEDFLKNNQESFKGTLYHIDVYRSESVESLYGKIGQHNMDREIFETFNAGRHKYIKNGDTVRYLYPIKAEKECLKCHANAKHGDVIGVIDIKEDLKPTINEARKKMITLLFLVLPIPFLIAFVAAQIVNRRINRSTGILHGRIENINRVKDLKLLEMEDIKLSFEEFDIIFDELKKVIQKLRDTAVDKDILEFEVKLLERFIITSEVVKDWKDHVKQILIEINKIMEAYFLFSLFKVGDETYDLEVFWRHTPSQRMKDVFDKIMSEKLAKTHHFRDIIIGLNINHNIAQPTLYLPDLKEEDIEFRTKSLILEAPKIGGIVGIGVNSELSVDPTRFLVIDSILTTLLNVVGSVKAIYKYTKDLEYFATRDPLTNLFNQRVFWELLYYEMERSKRHEYKFALMVIDIDNFKIINDTYGHVFGDNYLREFASLLRTVKRTEDIMARYGGDEFTVILPEADEEQAYLVAKRIVDSAKEFSVTAADDMKVRVTVSIGISVFPEHAQESKDLFLLADNMMYRAKLLGKDRIGIPTRGDVAEVFRSIGEKNIMITRAIEDKRIVPYFQPIMNAANKAVEAYEVLMRIDMPDKMIAAGEFIEIAENMGVISRMDYILMEKAFVKVKENGYKGHVFFNFSPKALILNEFIPTVRKLVKDFGIDPSKIVFEITERDTVRNIGLLEKFVYDLKFEGFKFAIDDFGSGFSSYQYIKRFPIDFVKVEGEFIRGMVGDKEMDSAIVLSIATLAKGFGIKTVAEYVEDEEIMKAVVSAGIDYAQGYYIGRPSPDIKIVPG